MLLALGTKLLTLFFMMRSEQCSRASHQTASGDNLPYQRDTHRNYVSIFGKVPLWRPYFYKKGVGGVSPLDAQLGLGANSYSDLVREISDYLAVYTVYHQSSDILSRLLGLQLSTRVIADNVRAAMHRMWTATMLNSLHRTHRVKHQFWWCKPMGKGCR
jgi:hypothetical protein